MPATGKEVGLARTPRLALVIIAFVSFISLGLPDGVLGVAWPSVRHSFGLPVSQMGVLLTASTCGYLLSSFSSGSIVRRLGVGRLLLVSSVLIVVGSLGYALSPRWPVMVGFGVFMGLGAGAIDAGMNAYSAHHFSPRVVNWLHAFYGVGATLGPLLMTAVLAAGLAWRWGYAINAMLLSIMAVCFLFTLKLWEEPVDREAQVVEAPLDPARAPAALVTLRQPVVMLSIVLFFLYTGIEVAVGQWTYSLFTESRGVAKPVAGIWVGVYWASLTVGRLIFGQVAAHVSPLTLVRGSMLVAPLGAALIWAKLTPPASFLGLALMGFCFAPMFPLMISMTPARTGAKSTADQLIGFQVSAACLGAAGVPGITGLLARSFGLEIIGPVLLVVALLLLAAHEAVVWMARGAAPRDAAVAPAG